MFVRVDQSRVESVGSAKRGERPEEDRRDDHDAEGRRATRARTGVASIRWAPRHVTVRSRLRVSQTDLRPWRTRRRRKKRIEIPRGFRREGARETRRRSGPGQGDPIRSGSAVERSLAARRRKQTQRSAILDRVESLLSCRGASGTRCSSVSAGRGRKQEEGY